MSDTLALWDKLGKTDPAHTKGFNRAGGFKGTAIKPIYTTKKMTEVFGPAGTGWGMGKPVFQVVPGSDGQVAVYCTVSLWYREVADDGIGMEPPTVYGVGGDMVVVKQSDKLRTDDEAFKKAFTDAIGNAMKHIGMSADVHMGLFDDSKYVSELRAEMQETFTAPASKADSRDVFSNVLEQLRAAGNKGRAELRAYWTSEEFAAAYETMPVDWRIQLTAEKDAFLASYPKPTGKVDPAASLDRQFTETMRQDA